MTDISWNKYIDDCNQLARSVASDYDMVVAITRGGLIPAQIVSYYSDIRYIDTIGIQSYSNENEQATPVTVKHPYFEWKYGNILIIDDLADTGKTMEHAARYFSNVDSIDYAAVYCKPEGKENLHYWVEEFEQDNWLIFPYDKVNRVTDLLTK